MILRFAAFLKERDIINILDVKYRIDKIWYMGAPYLSTEGFKFPNTVQLDFDLINIKIDCSLRVHFYMMDYVEISEI